MNLGRHRPSWRAAALGGLLLAGAGAALACSVPVFRYALERWRADDYLVVVFHEGPLTVEQAAWVRDLDRPGLAGKVNANLALRTVDLAAPADAAGLGLWRRLTPAPALPAMVLLYPPGLGNPALVWRGPLSGASVRQLLDSPRRREIARRLLQGQCAVWVWIESGDTKLDTEAARTLEARLKHLEATLVLPELDPTDLVGGAAAAREKLQVAFSALRISRNDPAEAVLRQMLLQTEEDLATAREPVVFPIFGRGRTLEALVGRGINAEMIDEAGRFLTGACSCIVKEQNPGCDLLLAADWDKLVEPLIRSDEEPPPLASVAAFAPAQAAGAAGREAPVARPVAKGGGSAAEAAPGASAGVRSVLPGLLLVGGAGAAVLLGATWWLLRRRG